MHVPVTSNFDDDPIKNEQASMDTSLSNYQSMGYFSGTQGQLTHLQVVGYSRNSNSSNIDSCPYNQQVYKNSDQ